MCVCTYIGRMYSIVSIIRLGRLGLLEFEIEIVLVVQIETFLDFHVLRLSKLEINQVFGKKFRPQRLIEQDA